MVLPIPCSTVYIVSYPFNYIRIFKTLWMYPLLKKTFGYEFHEYTLRSSKTAIVNRLEREFSKRPGKLGFSDTRGEMVDDDSFYMEIFRDAARSGDIIYYSTCLKGKITIDGATGQTIISIAVRAKSFYLTCFCLACVALAYFAFITYHNPGINNVALLLTSIALIILMMFLANHDKKTIKTVFEEILYVKQVYKP
ncbi:hypothetical protein [Foetidibacter luteolus]|uniref:hypothetical protein n=1 Tax=Foetidibacter luteolus TaxID=2608880 RepID=UPI00129A6CDA|nr:hypothetical protein [Foetidibacter luteolus]